MKNWAAVAAVRSAPFIVTHKLDAQMKGATRDALGFFIHADQVQMRSRATNVIGGRVRMPLATIVAQLLRKSQPRGRSLLEPSGYKATTQ